MSQRKAKVWPTATLATLLGLGILTCERAPDERFGSSPTGTRGATTLERIQRQGTARVGYANEAPYAYYDPTSRRLTGEAPEIARYILKQMGISRIEGILTEFGSLIPGLKAKRFDLIAAGMYITPARCQQIAFSEPTYGIGQAFIVKTRNPLNLHSYNDVTIHPTASLGVVAGAVERGYAQASGIPLHRIVIFPDAPSAVAGVQAGRVDAYAGTSPTIQTLLAKVSKGGIERAEPFIDPLIQGKRVRGYGAFGFRQEDAELLHVFNTHLKALVGSPRHLGMVKPFGFTEADMPGERTTAQLCAP